MANFIIMKDSIKKCRRNHKCDLCKSTIEKGKPYSKIVRLENKTSWYNSYLSYTVCEDCIDKLEFTVQDQQRINKNIENFITKTLEKNNNE